MSTAWKSVNFTFYGLEAYHDRFAGRQGNFSYLLALAKAALTAGLEVSAGLPLFSDNIDQTETLLERLRNLGLQKFSLFIPHEEGRGVLLHKIRLSEDDFGCLHPETQTLLNPNIYKTEQEWLRSMAFVPETQRMLLISLTPENLPRFENMAFADLIADVEKRDDDYYAATPSLSELAARYGDPESKLPSNCHGSASKAPGRNPVRRRRDESGRLFLQNRNCGFPSG